MTFGPGGAPRLGLGRPDIKELWLRGYWADLFLLAGGVVIAVVAGVLRGLWCAARPRSRAARAVEGLAMFFLCAPVYAVALGVLLLFAPPFGLFELPYFFEANSYRPPLESPWDFVRSMPAPWLVVAAPLAAAILRLTLMLTLDAMGEEQFIDIPMLQTLAMWPAVLIVALSLLGDLAIVRLDPRVRSAGRTVG